MNATKYLKIVYFLENISTWKYFTVKKKISIKLNTTFAQIFVDLNLLY